jgi:hypothetical protein
MHITYAMLEYIFLDFKHTHTHTYTHTHTVLKLDNLFLQINLVGHRIY